MFQIAAVLLAAVLFVVVAPLYLREIKPQREQELGARLVDYVGPENYSALLPPKDADVDRESRQMVNQEFYKLIDNDPWARSEKDTSNQKFWGGVLDLTLAVKSIDPSNSMLEMFLTGYPYGLLAYTYQPDQILILGESLSYGNSSVTLMGCRQPDRGNPRCADLRVTVAEDVREYSSGEVIGYQTMVSKLNTVAGVDHYPFDKYVARGLVQAEIVYKVPITYGFVYNSRNNKPMPDSIRNATIAEPSDQEKYADLVHNARWVAVRLEIQPGSDGWSTASASISKSNLTVFRRNGNGTTSVIPPPGLVTQLLTYEIVYQRSAFVRFFAVAVTLLMWVQSVYLMVLSIDHVYIRPRSLDMGTVGFAVGMLFALPTLRSMLDAPIGSYIDFLGFVWCMMLVAIAVIVLFSGAYADYDHAGEIFIKHQAPQEVAISGVSEDTVQALVQLLRKHGGDDAGGNDVKVSVA